MIEDSKKELNTNKEYIYILYFQFLKAQGIKHAEFSKHKKEFVSWLSAMYGIKDNYADLLLYMNSDSRLIGELGKGKYDSVVPNLNSRGAEAIAITPYADTFDSSVKAYDGKIVIGISSPFIKYSTLEKQMNLSNINPLYNTDIETLITQLPVGENQLKALVQSSYEYNDIMVGTYGFTNDKDRKEKRARLNEIRDCMENICCIDCDEELVEENGIYQHILMSKQKKLTLQKSLYR